MQLAIHGSELLQVRVGAAQAVGSTRSHSLQQDFVYHNQQQSFLNWLKGNDTQSNDTGYIAGLFHGFSYEPGSGKDRFKDLLEKNGLRIAKNVHQLFLNYFNNVGRLNGHVEDSEIKDFLYTAFITVNQELKKKFSSLLCTNGTTATIAYRVGNRLFIANVGHNRAVWGSTCNDQSADHTPDNPEEKKWFSEDSFSLSYGGRMRLDGDLNVTRFFGYTHILNRINPKWVINPVPDIVVIDLSKNPIIIIGTGSVWNGISEKGSEEAFQKNDNRFAYTLIKQALQNRSIDEVCLALIAAAICYRHNISKKYTKCLQLVNDLALKSSESSFQNEQQISKAELKEKIKSILQGLSKNEIKYFIDKNQLYLDDNATVIVMHATYEPLSISKKSLKPIITTHVKIRNALLLCVAFYVILQNKNFSSGESFVLLLLILYTGMRLDNILFKNC
jgi:serine/threonine protein phosphatase PrpC